MINPFTPLYFSVFGNEDGFLFQQKHDESRMLIPYELPFKLMNLSSNDEVFLGPSDFSFADCICLAEKWEYAAIHESRVTNDPLLEAASFYLSRFIDEFLSRFDPRIRNILKAIRTHCVPVLKAIHIKQFRQLLIANPALAYSLVNKLYFFGIAQESFDGQIRYYCSLKQSSIAIQCLSVSAFTRLDFSRFIAKLKPHEVFYPSIRNVMMNWGFLHLSPRNLRSLQHLQAIPKELLEILGYFPELLNFIESPSKIFTPDFSWNHCLGFCRALRLVIQSQKKRGITTSITSTKDLEEKTNFFYNLNELKERCAVYKFGKPPFPIFAKDGLRIWPIVAPPKLVEEGKELKHCLGEENVIEYCDAISKGKLFIYGFHRKYPTAAIRGTFSLKKDEYCWELDEITQDMKFGRSTNSEVKIQILSWLLNQRETSA